MAAETVETVEAPASATPASPSTPSTAAPPAASQPAPKWEDTPQYKGQIAELQKERQARQEYQRKIAEYETQLTEERRRVGALTGIQPRSKEQDDLDLVKERLAEMYPGLKNLDEINGLREQLEEQQVQSYATHSKGMIGQIHARIATEFGGDLTEGQKRFINSAYLFANQNPEIHERHNAGDPKLIEEFVKDVVDNMVEPIRSKARASEASRFRPVPGGRDRSAPTKGETPKKGEDMLRAHFREHTR